MIVLKNNSGTDDNRVRKLDYCIQFSELFYKRFLKNEDITLFSPYEAKELYDAFGHENFDELYEQYERKTSLKFKKTIKARKLMSLFVKERVETGRIYFMNIDHCNQKSAWDDDIKMTNLCVEVLHPTQPLQHPDDKNAEIGICILSAINVLEIQSDAEMEKVCDIIVRILDQLIDYQDYFLPAAENFTKNRRSLGIGITNFAAYLAKQGVKYTDDEAPNVADELMEKIQYYLLSASCDLSNEKGKCPKFNKTKYSQGWLPIDNYKKEIDEFVTRKHSMDWEGLRQRIKESGLRHSTVSAIMPCESSSVIQCSTNGIEPIRSYITYKKSKARTLPVIVPNYSSYKNKYTLAYDMEDNTGLIKIVGALQKWVDMSISANMYYNYAHYEKGALPDSKVIKEILLAYKLGWRTGYYNNTDDGDKQSFNEEEQKDNIEEGCESGACAL
jgi:ribonucleoside-diphosphate reductase alpha chain